LSFNKILGSGKNTLFWKDWLLDGRALFNSYALLYSIVVKPDITVVDAYPNDIFTLDLDDNLYLLEWIHLHKLVGILVLNPMMHDICKWR
jgi:hypothetical protein